MAASLGCAFADAVRRVVVVFIGFVAFSLISFGAASAAQILVGVSTPNQNLGTTFSRVTSVTASTNTPVDSAVFELFRVGGSPGSGSIFMEVRQGATVVATGSIARSIANTADVNYTITFAAPFSATAGAV